jgi:hypothetical protein
MHPPRQPLVAKTPRERVPVLSATASKIETPRPRVRKRAAVTGQRYVNPEAQTRLKSRKTPTTALRNTGDATVSANRTPSVATATSRTVVGVRERTEDREMSVARTVKGKAAGAIARATVRTIEDGIVSKPRRSLNGLTSQ